MSRDWERGGEIRVVRGGRDQEGRGVFKKNGAIQSNSIYPEPPVLGRFEGP